MTKGDLKFARCLVADLSFKRIENGPTHFTKPKYEKKKKRKWRKIISKWIDVMMVDDSDNVL